MKRQQAFLPEDDRLNLAWREVLRMTLGVVIAAVVVWALTVLVFLAGSGPTP
jgi:hypothetical protein